MLAFNNHIRINYLCVFVYHAHFYIECALCSPEKNILFPLFFCKILIKWGSLFRAWREVIKRIQSPIHFKTCFYCWASSLRCKQFDALDTYKPGVNRVKGIWVMNLFSERHITIVCVVVLKFRYWYDTCFSKAPSICLQGVESTDKHSGSVVNFSVVWKASFFMCVCFVFSGKKVFLSTKTWNHNRGPCQTWEMSTGWFRNWDVEVLAKSTWSETERLETTVQQSTNDGTLRTFPA